MHIRILGSGASEGIPAFLCNCTVCSQARRRRGKEIRQNALALVAGRSGESLLIDMPPQFKMSWDQGRFSHERLLAVLVTHRHDDHSLGLKYILDADPKNGVRDAHRLEVYLPRDVFDLRIRPHLGAGDTKGGVADAAAVRIRPLQAYKEISIGPFKVTPLETNHLGAFRSEVGLREEDFGFIIEDSDGKLLAYLVDAPAVLPDRTLELLSARRLDCLVCECTFGPRALSSQHMDVDGLLALRRSLTAEITIATHISHQNSTHAELRRALEPHGIRIAFDGMLVRF